MAGAITAEALLLAGHDVKQSEVHGMAQRGGSVVSHIRFGPQVHSPLVPLGTAEALVGFEWAEALRWLPYVRPGGAVVADVRRILPPGACRDRRGWSTTYPPVSATALGERVATIRLIDASAVAAELGNVRVANTVVLGALAAFLDVPDDFWEESIRRHVPPHTVEVNVTAFRAGREVPAARMRPMTPSPAPGTRRARIEVSTAWCKGCPICSTVCPEYCLAVDPDGQLQILDPEACTGCRLCELLCPDFAITIHWDDGGRPEPAARGPVITGGRSR
jgi:indolepyruvate ferredoxin oxidoreductase beta subunit